MADGNQKAQTGSVTGPPASASRSAPRIPPPPPPRRPDAAPEYPPRKRSIPPPQLPPKRGAPYPAGTSQQGGAPHQMIVPKQGGPSQQAGASRAAQKSPEESATGARPKEESTHRSFAEYVKDNRSEEALQHPKQKPDPKKAPERSRVSMNPAGRSDPTPRLPTVESDDSPKKGLFSSLFSKAKDFFFKKPQYTPLEQKEEQVGKSPKKEPEQRPEKYTPFYDEGLSPPARYFLQQYEKSAKVAPLPPKELEFESSDEKSEPSLDMRLATRSSCTGDAVSDHSSEFSDSSDHEYKVASEIAWPIISLPGSSTATFRASETTDLCNIKVNSPAEVHVAYGVTGYVTTCIRQTTDTVLSNFAVSIQPDAEVVKDDIKDGLVSL